MPAMASAARDRVSPVQPLSATLLGAVVARSDDSEGQTLRALLASYDPAQVADTALERLAAAPEDRVLELGCGSGRLLFRLAARARRGLVVGIDPSELMVRHARHRNRSWIAAGRARVEQAWSRDLSRFDEASFDRVLGVHVVCFWEEPARDLEEVRRVLRPGGRLLLGFRPVVAGAGDALARVPVERVERWLRWSKLTVIDTVLRGDPERPLAWVRARR
jgi:SAM-dependent methyltransferase